MLGMTCITKFLSTLGSIISAMSTVSQLFIFLFHIQQLQFTSHVSYGSPMKLKYFTCKCSMIFVFGMF